ncbi:flagellar hook-basal body complex protein FliE [Thiomicrorhabdus sp. ZW0627]|uniref:flagellar hook-basal body complex protein FliE n=1 Tax=Thiomicrorhabdus sp. ZW0627 TaxID=3039774 RepID=UPI0024368411|nr:flagellar hook-basal body complex protein FliE [Thiomicrorhabdus sp. ZW0627]MDG6773347.1 flagellar hook-basal body complex protein FliE [Thiomicrorhabdus sp. ZW0627]
MSTIDTQSLMLQMRSLAAQAASKPDAPVEGVAQTGEEKADNFAELLASSVNAVNSQQQKAGQMKEAFERGDLDVELSEVMLQAQKASLSFQAMTQVRNKLTEAYKDIMNMPI